MDPSRRQRPVTMALVVGGLLGLCAFAGFVGLVGGLGCAGTWTSEPSLYVQLGERRGIERLVDGLLREMARDERIAHHFRRVDIGRFREQLGIHLCEVAGGPCRYEGESMADVHRGMGIRQGEFNALVEHMIHVMESLRLSTATQNELLARLAPMQPDIVEGRWERR